MQAKVLQKNGVVVVNLEGFIDVETAGPFKEACMKSLGKDGGKVVFNLEGLNFVGSNGILPFVESLFDICDQKPKQINFCKVSSEFQKVFKASPLRDIDIFSDETGAISAHNNPIKSEG
jgi:anti-anti-sigma factor